MEQKQEQTIHHLHALNPMMGQDVQNRYETSNQTFNFGLIIHKIMLHNMKFEQKQLIGSFGFADFISTRARKCGTVNTLLNN